MRVFFEASFVVRYRVFVCERYRLVRAPGFVEVFEHLYVEEKFSVFFALVQGDVLVSFAMECLFRAVYLFLTDGANFECCVLGFEEFAYLNVAVFADIRVAVSLVKQKFAYALFTYLDSLCEIEFLCDECGEVRIV